MKISLDDDGYFYSPFITASTLLYIMQKNTNKPFNEFRGHESIETIKKMCKKFNINTFCDFISHHKDSNDANEVFMKYHLYRFLNNGSITYKIRPNMLDFFDSSTLDYPAKLFLPPFKEFMISLPVGAVKVDGQGSIFNIYCSEEDFDQKYYENKDKSFFDESIISLVSNNIGKIKRVLRCYAVLYDDNLDFYSGRTLFYQLPIIEDEKIHTQFTRLHESALLNSDGSIIKIFNIVLKLCSYFIGSKNPDIQKVNGSIRSPKSGNVKKIAAAEKHNNTLGYNYFDVGRLYQSKPSEVSFIRDAHGILKKHFMVRRHFRAQWYGPKTELQPNGTHQEVIVIEEFEKGPEIEMKPKIIIV